MIRLPRRCDLRMAPGPGMARAIESMRSRLRRTRSLLLLEFL